MQPPGPPPPGQPPPPPPYSRQAPPPYYAPPFPSASYGAAPTDAKATVALVLGIISIMTSLCYGIGFLFGIPALILGVVSRKQIARSEGAVGGGGVALAGAITGGIGGGLSVLYIGVLAVVFAIAASAARAPTYAPTTSPTVTPTVSFTELHPSGGPLRSQLAAEWARADAAHEKLMVMTSATWSKEAAEIVTAFADDEVQDALEDVVVVRVDVDEFKAELGAAKLEKPEVPWFFIIGATFEPTDAISADEWGANTPSAIAPVIRKFVLGTLTKRRVAPPRGTSL